MKNKNTLKRLLSFIKDYKILLYMALLCSAINIIFTLWTPVLIGQAIDQMIGKHEVHFMILYKKIAMIIFSVIMTSLFSYLVMRLSNTMTYNITRDFRKALFKQYHQLPLKFIDASSHGDLMSRMIADIDLISDGLLQGFTNLFAGIMTIIGTIVFMLMINVKIALIVIILTPLSLAVSSIIATKTYKYFQEQLKIRGELSGFVEEMIGNQKVVKAFSHEEENKENFNIRVVHQENKGLGGARNIGIDVATGEYLFFIDSDDTIIDSTLEDLSDYIQNNDVDILTFDIVKVDENGNQLYFIYGSSQGETEFRRRCPSLRRQ